MHVQPSNKQIVFSSDLHGNLKQYQKLVDFAHDNDAKAILIGGDLFPKRKKGSHEQNTSVSGDECLKTVSFQLQFYKESLLPILQQKEFQNKIPVYVTFGNADFFANIGPLKKITRETEGCNHISILHSEVVTLNFAEGEEAADNFHLLAYSSTTFSPHKMKDFERFDNWENVTLPCSHPEQLDGFVSFSDEEVKEMKIPSHFVQETAESYYGKDVRKLLLSQLVPDFKNQSASTTSSSGGNEKQEPVSITHEQLLPWKELIERYSIDYEMNNLLKEFLQKSKADSSIWTRSIWMCHCPLHNTNGDLTKGAFRTGSKALRKFVEECQPLVTLHGHIHESVDQSGNFKEVIGKQSVTMSSGNYPNTEQVAILLVDLKDPNAALRILV